MVQKHFCTTTYIFNPEGSLTLLIKHKKLGFLLPPGGHIEENEDYFESAQREVAEELGIDGSLLTYPDVLNPLKGVCRQPWEIQKYTIVPEEHFHYDLVFVAIASESVDITPGEGESNEYAWYAVDKIESLHTTPECRSNIKRISEVLAKADFKEPTDLNPYLWPVYNQSVADDLTAFLSGRTFNDWNLGDIYTETPRKFAKKLGSAHGIFTASGTAGLHAILLGLGVRPGDEVIVPSMTFIRAVTPLVHLGATPVVADIDGQTGNITLESIQQNVTDKTKAVIVVHMWGVPADIAPIADFCKSIGILLIEDFSHAHYSKYKDGYVGSYGDAGFASLQRKKMISVGEGGLVVTNDSALFERLKDITSPGSFNSPDTNGEVDFSGYGLNMRMSPFSAVTARNLIDIVPRFINDRKRAVEVISGILSDYPEAFRLFEVPEYATEISWYSYKVELIHTSLEKLKGSKLWKFSSLGYPAIGDHVFWSKDADRFPFSQGVHPVIRHELPGHQAYLANRVTLNIPTVPASYWNDDTISKWRQELRF